MPGLWLHDFGDLVRSGTCPVKEDEQDLDKVVFNRSFYDAIKKGYLSGAAQHLNETELKNLAFSAKLLTFELSIRFLTDYLAGDIYFQVSRPQQNLDRFRVQRRLLEGMEASFE
jgi:hypothetical protein